MLCLKELGLRIQQLKSEGATGKALKEFASDPEVKKMVASDEIASRKKQVSTKIGTGNKSLADMQKLHAELAKYGDDHELMAVVGFLPEELLRSRQRWTNRPWRAATASATSREPRGSLSRCWPSAPRRRRRSPSGTTPS
jgi:hypothetical protein